MSVRDLAYLFCAKCNSIELHKFNQCMECKQPNKASGNPPARRPYQRFNNIRPERFNASVEEAGQARRRARAARHHFRERGHT